MLAQPRCHDESSPTDIFSAYSSLFLLDREKRISYNIFMSRDIVKVRKVGGTLVVTLTQAVLEQVAFSEGDRVLVEAVPPRRIIISKEGSKMPNTRRIELEIEALEAKQKAIESDVQYKTYQHNNSMPSDEGMGDASVAQLILFGLCHERDTVAANIAQKRLELFELQGA